VAFRLTTAAYRPLFEQMWGAGSLNIKFPKNTEAYMRHAWRGFEIPRERDANPSSCGRAHQSQRSLCTLGTVHRFIRASLQVSAFSSKFDAFLVGKYKLTADEMAGFQLFTARATAIHVTSTGEERV